MTGLAHNNMHVSWRVAGRTFKAKCGHTVLKGEEYHVFDDFFSYTRMHNSSCKECVKVKVEAVA